MSTAWSDNEARTLLRRIFDAAVASADPGPAVLRHLPEKPKGRCIVVGAGKASAAMAAALDAAWPDVELTGRRRHPLRPCRAGRADPDRRGLTSGPGRHERDGGAAHSRCRVRAFDPTIS